LTATLLGDTIPNFILHPISTMEPPKHLKNLLTSATNAIWR